MPPVLAAQRHRSHARVRVRTARVRIHGELPRPIHSWMRVHPMCRTDNGSHTMSGRTAQRARQFTRAQPMWCDMDARHIPPQVWTSTARQKCGHIGRRRQGGGRHRRRRSKLGISNHSGRGARIRITGSGSSGSYLCVTYLLCSAPRTACTVRNSSNRTKKITLNIAPKHGG